MGAIDLHSKPFDEQTITKLLIFENYAQAWIPTFVMMGEPVICIFDLFAGTGYDNSGIAGSAIRILKKIDEQRALIFQKKAKVRLYLNEFEPHKKAQQKFELLKTACEEYMSNHPSLYKIVDIHYYNEDFEIVFPRLLAEVKCYPSLLFLDQNGIKFTSKNYFLELEGIPKTDFLYFISSSYVWRFGEQEEFKAHLAIDMEEIKKNPYKFIHRSLIAELRKKLSPNTRLKLYPFSLKKGANIHGLIFGASHPRAVDKFLKIVWGQNENNGQANFDIDNEATANQYDIFTGATKKTRIEFFYEDIENKILKLEIKNNFELYQYTLAQGHIDKHASDCIKNMKRKKLIAYNSPSPLVNYENVYKRRRLLEYKVQPV